MPLLPATPRSPSWSLKSRSGRRQTYPRGCASLCSNGTASRCGSVRMKAMQNLNSIKLNPVTRTRTEHGHLNGEFQGIFSTHWFHFIGAAPMGSPSALYPPRSVRWQSIGKGARSSLELKPLGGAGNSRDAAMTVETILRRKGADVATIEPEASIRRAADWLRVKKIGALVVTSGKTVLGLISEREIAH